MKRRTPRAAFDDIPGELPISSAVPDQVDLKVISQDAVSKLNALQEDSLAANLIWRDLLALTDYYRTFYSIPVVISVLKKLRIQKKCSVFTLQEDQTSRVAKTAGGASWIDVEVKFTAQHGSLAQCCMCETWLSSTL